MVTKLYKRNSHQEFLDFRTKVWQIQFGVLIAAACVGFPTTILYKIRVKLGDDPEYVNLVSNIDWATFYIFVAGIYKDFRKSVQNYYYFTFFLLAFGLVLEKQSINWLKNRMGCNFNRLQKFIELDLRMEAITKKWSVQVPKYDINAYKDHYLLHDFDTLKKQFRQSESEENDNATFVPYKVACRIRDFVTFSVKLAGRAPDLELSELDIELLNKMEKDKSSIDYESVPVLKNYKIEQLEKILKDAINRKYKISFLKGMQLAFETFILLILMVSVVLKANLFSLVYLLFIFKFLVSRGKTYLLVRMVSYMSVCFLAQYLLYLLNITDAISPADFPEQFQHYPKNSDSNDYNIKYALPFFFHFESFRDLKLSYLIGIGIEVD